MSAPEELKTVLVLLIGEVLEDPRVHKTCLSLRNSGADVTVVCTNPSGRLEKEIADGIGIVRFPHRREFILKRLYNRLGGLLKPEYRRVVSQIHEDVPSSSVMAALRNTVLTMNFNHFMRSTEKIGHMMTGAFPGRTFDLVHCNDVDTLAAGCILRRSGAAKTLVYDAHEFWPGIGVHGSAPNTKLRELEAEGIVYADRVVTVNSMIAEMIGKEYGLKTVPSVVMNCPPLFGGPVFTDMVHDPVRVLYQGKVQAFRGLEELVLAFRHIDGAVLTISGYGPLVERLERLRDSEGLGGKVTITGKYAPDEALGIITGHDIGVLPFNPVTLSIMYSSPNKLFDYAMGGLALAANDLPYLKRVIEEHAMGRIFPDNDPEKIAEAINTMAGDREKLKEYKRNARKAAEEHFHWDKQFTNYPWRP
ncbi:glycosyltransferase [bacterium]|nr:glycosyltransferase [bacterium]